MFGKNLALLRNIFLVFFLQSTLVDSFILPKITERQLIDSRFSQKLSFDYSLQNTCPYKQTRLSVNRYDSEPKAVSPLTLKTAGMKFSALLTVYLLNNQVLPAIAYDSIPDKEVVEALEGPQSTSGNAFGYINFEIFDELARKPLKIPFFLLGAYVVFNSIEIFYLNIKGIFENMSKKDDTTQPPSQGPSRPTPSAENDNMASENNDTTKEEKKED